MRIGILIPSIYMRSSLASKRVSSTVKLTLAQGLANELVNLGHEVFVFGPKDIDTKAKIISCDSELLDHEYTIEEQQDVSKESFEKVSLYERKKYYEIGVTSFAYEYAREHNIDVMHHFHSLGYLAHYFDTQDAPPSIFTLHIPPPPMDTLVHYRMKKFQNAPYIAISKSHKNEYLTAYPLLNIAGVIHHGVNLDEYPFSDQSEDYLAFIGRATEDKGIDTAIEVSNEMNKNIQLATWVTDIVKKTPFYQEKIAPHLTSPNVAFKGLLSPSERNIFLQKAKAFIFPLRWSEPFGMVMLESMATGTPVISYANGSLPEIVEDGKTGYLVNMDENHITGNWIIQKTGKEGLKEAVEKIYSLSPEKYSQMRKQSRERVRNYFTEKVMAENHVKLYKSLRK